MRAEETAAAREKMDAAYAGQLRSFGADKLKAIGELNLLRCPLAYDRFFLDAAIKPALYDLVRHFLGDYFIINSQSPPGAKKAAWDLVKHLLSPLNQLSRWSRMKQLAMPVFPGAFAVTTDLVDKPEFKLVKDAITYARTEPSVENWPRIRDYLEKMVLERALTEEGADLPGLLRSAAQTVKDSLL